ncbi:MAG TPA: hypothetical protein VGQ71_11540 [Terriglobales bacterium]|nr:hypothetical protein [Terriglobales bacterium]
MRARRLCVLLFFLVVASCGVAAQRAPEKKPASPPREKQPAAESDAAEKEDAYPFKGLTWREIGPFRGGRALAVSGIPGDATTFYFGAVAGGVWKTSDGGNVWIPISDKEDFASIGSIAVAESDPNVIYVGTGEACIRGNIIAGNGVYKSTDAGKTWKHVGLRDTQTIGKVIVNPRDPNIVFVAALGHAFGPNQERGVFRSSDGGKTWEKVLYKDDKTGAIDITFDPSNPSILFAALWQAYRKPWLMESGGPGSGLYRSTDGGSTWKRLQNNGLPKGILGRIGVAVSGTNGNRVYALIEAEDGGLYRSEDGGEKWQLINPDRRFRQRAWYYTHVYADPKNADTVYILNVSMWRSIDGGKTFTDVRAPHGDHHGLWIDPQDPRRMINANDGGANVTLNGGASWTTQANQPTAQFYHVITDNRFPYHIYGAQQDNSTVAIASLSEDGVIDRSDWYPVGGCESGYIAPDPRDANVVYAGCFGGIITRFDKRTGQERIINVWPESPIGHGSGEMKHRFQWTAPIFLSPHDPNVLYIAGERLFKSIDAGMSWAAISPDLTRNDKAKQASSGGPVTKDNTTVEYYDTIFTAVESAKQKGLLWVGSDDGLAHISTDSGANWSNITPKGLPEWSRVTLIEVSPHDAATAYLSADRHELDDFAPYIYKTADYGNTWTKITTGLPDGAYVRAVREDPTRRGLLFAGTKLGIFVSFDDGAHWQTLRGNLPPAPIADLVIKDDDLVVATHGRSFWVLDDISPLRQWNAQIAAADIHLFAPGTTYRIQVEDPQVRPHLPLGKNPPSGAIIYYELKKAIKKPEKKKEDAAGNGQTTPDEEKSPISLQILDSQGKVIRTYPPPKPAVRVVVAPERAGPESEEEKPKELATEAGVNRFVWDLRYEDATKVPKSPIWFGSTKGPVGLPGKYQVRLTVEGKSFLAPFEIKMDPRITTSVADLEKQFQLLSKIHQRLDQVHLAVNQIRDVRRQAKELEERLKDDPRGKAISEAGKQLAQKMKPLEEELIQV